MKSFRCAFTIKSDTRYLSVLREWIFAAALIVGRKRFPKRARVSCTLALIEAVDNAIFHAHKGRKHRPIKVHLNIDEGVVSVEVQDAGRGLGVKRASSPDLMLSHGRGLFLIHRLMTKVESRTKNGGHSLRMIYNI